jgi:enterochelin esterase-like enzyme
MKYLFFLILSASLFAQSEFGSFISHVNSINDPQQKNAAIDSFMVYARSKGIPFIEDSTANFIYRGNRNTVQIAGDFTSWNPNIAMNKLAATNFFYYSKNFELNARLDYKFVTDGTWILDPENPNRVSGGFGPNSELAMPEYIQPWEIKPDTNVPRGTLSYSTLYSTNTAAVYSIAIYLPPGYDSLLTEGYPAVYFQDGFEYINLGSAATVLDNLQHHNKIERTVGIFIKPNNRLQDYIGDNRVKYRLFFVNELVPYIDSIINTSRNPFRRVIIGDSAGGNISALISYNHPDVFANCGLHSGALWPNEYEAHKLIINGPVRNLRFAAVWGKYEALITDMRNFRDTLTIKGYDIKTLELPEGHSWGLWRATTDFILEFFLPGSAASIKDDINLLNDDFRLYQNYPNPFNPSTVINFAIHKNSNVNIKLFNALGKEVSTLLQGEFAAGDYKVNFDGKFLPSGVYYYRMNTDNSSETKKMILIK